MSQEMMEIRFAIKSAELADVIRRYSSVKMNDNENEEGDIDLDDFIDADYDGYIYADCNNITIGSLAVSEYDEMWDGWRPYKPTPKGKDIISWFLDVICYGNNNRRFSKEGKDNISNNLEALDDSIRKYKVIHLDYLPHGQSTVYYEMYDGDNLISYIMTPDIWKSMWDKRYKDEAQSIFEKYHLSMDNYSLDGVFAGDVFLELYEKPVFIQLIKTFGDKEKHVKGSCNEDNISNLLKSLDRSSINPEDIAFPNKIVLTNFSHIDGEGIYSYDEERYKDIDKSFLEKVSGEFDKVRLWKEYLVGLYDNAMYKTGAAILRQALYYPYTNYEMFDYVVATRTMEETFTDRHLQDYGRGELSFFWGEDSDQRKEEWKRSKLKIHNQLLKEEFFDHLEKLATRVKEANEKRLALKKSFDPIKIIWEDKLLRYFENNNLLNENCIGCEPDPARREIGKKTLDVFAEELLCRYNNDKFVTSQKQLINENPDLEEKIELLKKVANDLFDISFADYLREKGVIRNKNGKRIEVKVSTEPFRPYGIIRFLLLPKDKHAYTNLAFKSEFFFDISEEQMRSAAKGIKSLSMLVSNIEEMTKPGIFSETAVKKNDYKNIFKMDEQYTREDYSTFAIKYESSKGVNYDIRDF